MLRDGRSVAELPRGQLSEQAIMTALAGDTRRPTMAEALRRPSLDRPAGLGGLAPLLQRYGAVASLVLLVLVNVAITPNFLTLLDPQREPDPGRDDRDRGRGHDAGDRDGRHEPLGRLADGDLGAWRRWSSSGTSPCQPGVGVALAFVSPVLVAGLFGLFNGWLITRFNIQPIIATLVLFIAGRGIAQVMTNGNLQVFKNPEFQFIGIGRVFGLPFQVL